MCWYRFVEGIRNKEIFALSVLQPGQLDTPIRKHSPGVGRQCLHRLTDVGLSALGSRRNPSGRFRLSRSPWCRVSSWQGQDVTDSAYDVAHVASILSLEPSDNCVLRPQRRRLTMNQHLRLMGRAIAIGCVSISNLTGRLCATSYLRPFRLTLEVVQAHLAFNKHSGIRLCRGRCKGPVNRYIISINRSNLRRFPYL